MHACGKNKKSKVSVKSEFYENVMLFPYEIDMLW